jgi:acetyl esterase/lipase
MLESRGNSPHIASPARLTLLACLLGLIPAACGQSRPAPKFDRASDVVYGRKDGMALTMDVFSPRARHNRAGVIWVVSGGWVSSHDGIGGGLYGEFLERGYTVFAVVHGSQPRYTIPEVLEDVHRAIRFIRHDARRFGIDPDRIGIMGGSAGGHLSLMMGLDAQAGKPKKKDPVDQEPSRVRAVACFFPPTDFLNYGRPGRDTDAALREELGKFRAPFDFRELDRETGLFVAISDPARRRKIMERISPITHVSPDDPPTLIIHGDADALVPIEQSRRLVEKLQAAGVTARLVTRAGAKHGWPGLQDDMVLFADWFDSYLLKEPAAATATRPD